MREKSTHSKNPGLSGTLLVCLLCAGWILLLTGGCSHAGKPRLRIGAFFGSPTGMQFPNPDKLGTHRYASSRKEKNGMVYTCRGGFIDIGHVREAADRTAYLRDLLYKNLIRRRTEISYKVVEPSIYRAVITYPPGWDHLKKEEKAAIARQAALQMAQSFAHDSLVWHEILTWFGFSSTWIFPERISSFSWEDTYSDLLGITLAGEALADSKTYNRSMTERLNQALQDLEVQPSQVARRAAREIEGKWFTGGFYFFVEMKKRNFDTGLGYRPVTPVLVAGICPDAQPHPLKAPNLPSPVAGGFEADLTIYPVELEKYRIYRILNMDPDLPIRPSLHFPVLLEEIRQQAEDKYGPAEN